MFATDFEYDEKRLSEFNMIICSFDGASGIESVSSGADITYSQEKSSGSDTFHLHSCAYDSPYSSTFQICRNPCRTENPQDMYLSPEEISDLQTWLCRKSFHKFKIEQDSYSHIHWNTVFSTKQINFNGRIVGLELTMFADSPYAYLDEVVHKFHFDTHDIHDSNDVARKYFHTPAQAEGYTYPDLEIKIQDQGHDGKMSLWLNERKTEIRGCKAQETITIHGRQQVICTSDHNHDIAKDFNFIFPRMERDYQEHTNYLSADLACDITLRYFPVILTGL